MQKTANLMCDAHRRPRGFLVAVLISAAVHGLFAVLLGSLTTIHTHPVDAAPLAEIPVLVVSEEPIQVSLADDARTAAAGSPSSAEPNVGETQTVQVRPPPVATGEETPDAAVPRVMNVGKAELPTAGGDSADVGPVFLGVQVPARSVVFVIDRSLSMGLTDGLKTVKRELSAKLDRLPPGARFQVLFYDSRVECLPSAERDGLFANTEENRRRIRALTDSIRARAGTDHLTALLRALALRPEAVLFITDADDLGRDQVRSITDANAGKTAIHALQWGLTSAENDSLKELARLNRGSYRHFGP
jgi:hypothetical protein